MGDADKLVAGIAAPVGGVMTECGTSPPVEHILSAEDAVSFSALFWYALEVSLNYHFFYFKNQGIKVFIYCIIASLRRVYKLYL